MKPHALRSAKTWPGLGLGLGQGLGLGLGLGLGFRGNSPNLALHLEVGELRLGRRHALDAAVP